VTSGQCSKDEFRKPGQSRERGIPVFAVSCALLALLLCTAPGLAQEADADRFELRGMVVNSVTRGPVSRALVQINTPTGRMLLTGTDGVFVFTNLPHGKYQATAMKPGFFNEQEVGRWNAGRNSVKDVPSSGDLVLKLIPEGVIYGEVKDENGEPVEGITVGATRSRIVEGRRVFSHEGESLTNDEGGFRIAELNPGRYRLSFAAAKRGVVMFVTTVRKNRETEQGYAAEFYPGVKDEESAAAIEVRAGAEVHITQTMKRQRLFGVSGLVRGADPEMSFNLMLKDATGDYVPRSVRFDPKLGQFQITGVAEGNYILTLKGWGRNAGVTEENKRALGATQLIHLNSDLTDVVLTLRPVNRLEVRLRDEITPDGTNTTHRVRVRLISREFLQYSPATFTGGAEDEQYASGKIDDILPGAYMVEAAAFPAGYIASLRCGSADLLREDLTVAPGADLPPLEVILRNDGAQLSATVVGEGQRSVRGLVIYSEEFPRRSFLAQVDEKGEFSQSGIAPGRYLLIATENAQELEFRNPAAMQKYLGQATEVILQPGDKASVRVKLQVVEEQQQ
jgi:hypothetical protein